MTQMNIATTINLKKRGVGTVTLASGTYTNGEKWYTITANGVTTSVVSATALNFAYKQYMANGWAVAQPKAEKKVAAPSQPKAEKKTREQSLTEKYGDKKCRAEWMNAKKAFHRFYMVKVDSKNFRDHRDYLKAVDALTARALQKWEDAGRPAYNC